MSTYIKNNFVGQVNPNWAYNNQDFPDPPLTVSTSVIMKMALMGIGVIWWLLFFPIFLFKGELHGL